MSLILARDVWPKYDRLAAKLMSLRKADWKPLFEVWLDVIVEDNRAGVLSGLDKDGNRMAKVTYRTGVARKTRFRSGAAMGKRTARFTRKGLSGSEYQGLTGPPLAPRGASSRVIANLKRRPIRGKEGVWTIACGWDGVVSKRGTPFLPYHFNGAGRLPRRDLRGVRPQGVRRCVAYLKAFVQDLLGKEG
jgi:hypothetical protein